MKLSYFQIFLLCLFLAACSKTKPAYKTTDILAADMILESGVYPMKKASEVLKWQADRNAEVAVIATYPVGERWSDYKASEFMSNEYIPDGFKGNISISMPLWPSQENLDDAAAGKHADEWEGFGKMVAAKFPGAYMRVGAEMNRTYRFYHATPQNAEKWKQAFRHAATALRKASPNFQIVFNPIIGPGETGTPDATLFYPGDGYVNLIGLDAYDLYPAYTTEENISFHRDAAYGWNWWLDFAKQHNKKFCIPEWGLASAYSESGGDNPAFINFIYSWIKDNKDWVQMECYFNESDSYLQSALFNGRNPKASEEYKRWMSLLLK